MYILILSKNKSDLFFLFLAKKFQVVFDAIKVYRLSANTNICFFAWVKKNFANFSLH